MKIIDMVRRYFKRNTKAQQPAAPVAGVAIGVAGAAAGSLTTPRSRVGAAAQAWPSLEVSPQRRAQASTGGSGTWPLALRLVPDEPGQGSKDLDQVPTRRLPQPASAPPPLTRRYLIDSDYLLPKDLVEASRLDFQHFYLKHVLKSNYLAPLVAERVRTILDVGCGTGRWVLEMARAFPEARVYGVDLEWSTPPQKLPPNVSFQQCNVLEGLPYERETFDFVHQRFLAMGVPAAKWSVLLAELLRVTAPGGWIELLEGGDTFVNTGPALSLLIKWYRQACRSGGYDPGMVDRLGVHLQQMGLRSVKMETLSVPVGPWGRHEGIMLQKNLLTALPGLFPLLQRYLSIDEVQFNSVMQEIQLEMDTLHIEYQYYIVYGQK